MIYSEKISIFTHKSAELINMTAEIESIVAKSCISNGVAFVISQHTTTGLVINEPLECVEQDIVNTLAKLIPDDDAYIHAHFLPSYGATSNNSPGHLKSTMLGNSVTFSVSDSKLEKGSAQDVYLAECDGPQSRQIIVKIMGE